MKNRKLLAFIMTFIILFVNVPFNAYAQTEDNENDSYIEPRYTNIESTAVTLTAGTVTATCKATLIAKSSKSLKIHMIWERKDGSTYIPINDWTTTATGTTLTLTKKPVYNSLKSYRLKVEFTAGSETTTQYKYLT